METGNRPTGGESDARGGSGRTGGGSDRDRVGFSGQAGIVRIALIGTGGMGRQYAEMIVQGSISGMKLTAMVCRKEEARQWAQKLLPGKSGAEEDRAGVSCQRTAGAGEEGNGQVSIYASADELYRHPEEYDAVLIVTPHKTHPELAIRAFALGKHVFCDKPAGVSVLQAQRMLDAAQEADRSRRAEYAGRAADQPGILYAMMFHQRKYRKYRRIKELLDAGTVGRLSRISLFNSRYFRTAFYHHQGSWRSSWTGEGGGALINQGQHILDIWQWLFGLPKQLTAQIAFGKYNAFQVDDEATILMEYPDQVSGVFMLTTGEAVWEERMEIVGSLGTILMEDDRLTITRCSEDSREYAEKAQVTTRDEMNFTVTTEDYPFEKEPYEEMLQNFVAAFRGQEPLAATGEDGLRALQITNAAYLSAWTGRKVTLPVDALVYEQMLEEHVAQEKSDMAGRTEKQG